MSDIKPPFLLTVLRNVPVSLTCHFTNPWVIWGSLTLCITFQIALTARALQKREASTEDPFTEENEGMVRLNDNPQGTSIKLFSRGIFCLFPPPPKVSGV